MRNVELVRGSRRAASFLHVKLAFLLIYLTPSRAGNGHVKVSVFVNVKRDSWCTMA